MFSGITQGLFPVVSVKKKQGLFRYTVEFSPAFLKQIKIGASISIDGVCQTVISVNNNQVSFNAMQETLTVTTLSDLYEGRWVSAERSLCYGDEVGGHAVSGHVSGTARVSLVETKNNNFTLIMQCKPKWMRYILPKGFIAVDGSSLTVGQTDPAGYFTLHLIPETLRVTNFAKYKSGDIVNIELDQNTKVIVDTVERLHLTKA